MRRPHQIFAVLLACFSLLLLKEGLSLQYYTVLGPGPGFFPCWLAGLLFVLSVLLFVQAVRRESATLPAGWLPGRKAVWRMLAIPAALLWTILMMEVLGFRLTMFVFFLALVNLLGRQSRAVSLGVALAGSAGVYAVFTGLLDIPLPVGAFGF